MKKKSVLNSLVREVILRVYKVTLGLKRFWLVDYYATLFSFDYIGKGIKVSTSADNLKLAQELDVEFKKTINNIIGRDLEEGK